MGIRKVSDAKNPPQCDSPDHNPPTMILIPPGEAWEHVCDGCGKRTLMHGSPVRF
jgi:hypothetical protein